MRADDTGLRALDPQDGSVAWDRDIPDLCTLAEPNPAGDLVVTAGDSCRQVVFVHGDTGRIGWSTTLPLISKRYDDGNVVAAIGDRSVTVIQSADRSRASPSGTGAGSERCWRRTTGSAATRRTPTAS